MPAVLKANRRAISEKVKRLAAFLGIRRGFNGFTDYVLELRAGLGVPEGLAAFGIPDSSFEQIARMAPKDPTAGGNPVKLTRKLAAKMLESAR
jgi:alcohol dehydrogenase